MFVIADNNDEETYNYIKNKYKPEKVDCILSKNHRYVSGCWNYFTKNYFYHIEDVMLWLVDDVELHPDTLEKAVRTFERCFPDTDGVVGLNHICPGHPNYNGKPFAFNLIGKKFIERYPNRQVCCPDYTFWYQDEELYDYADSLIIRSGVSRFYFCKESLLNHYHPGFCKEEDETHRISRGNIYSRDYETYRQRKIKKLTWGKSFELINKDKNNEL